MYCREAETEEGGAGGGVVSPVLSCQSRRLKAEPSLPPPAAGDSDISGTREVKQCGGDGPAEAAAIQSSGLATDGFRKTQTPWNGGAKNKTVTLPPQRLEWSHALSVCLSVLCKLWLTPTGPPKKQCDLSSRRWMLWVGFLVFFSCFFSWSDFLTSSLCSTLVVYVQDAPQTAF